MCVCALYQLFYVAKWRLLLGLCACPSRFVHENSLSGTIPTELGKLTELTEL